MSSNLAIAVIVYLHSSNVSLATILFHRLCRPWTLDLGPWTWDLGPWTLDPETNIIIPLMKGSVLAVAAILFWFGDTAEQPKSFRVSAVQENQVWIEGGLL